MLQKTDIKLIDLTIKNDEILLILLFSACFGAMIYSIHRTIFYIIEFCVIKKKEKKSKIESIAEYFYHRINSNNSLDDYFIFRGATIHLGAITCEILIIHLVLKSNFLFIFLIIIWIIILIIHIYSIQITIATIDYKRSQKNYI